MTSCAITKLAKALRTDSYQGIQVPPIIDRELWEAAQRKLDNGKARSLRNATVAKDYLLARLIKCDCKSAVHVTWSEGRVGERRLYYRCPGRLASYGHRCTKPWQRADLTDALVWGRLSQTVLDPRWIEEFMRGQNENAGTQQVEVEIQKVLPIGVSSSNCDFLQYTIPISVNASRRCVIRDFGRSFVFDPRSHISKRQRCEP
jgi:hypothetical protein